MAIGLSLDSDIQRYVWVNDEKTVAIVFRVVKRRIDLVALRAELAALQQEPTEGELLLEAQASHPYYSEDTRNRIVDIQAILAEVDG